LGSIAEDMKFSGILLIRIRFWLSLDGTPNTSDS